MTEEINFILESAQEAMLGSVAHLEKEFLNIRAGKASPQMPILMLPMRERLLWLHGKKTCCILLKKPL